MAKSRHLKLIASAVFISLCSALTAYYRAFSALAPYDDEGTMMLTVKRFLDGKTLYDQVGSFYGPVYYFYEWCAHALAGVPVSTDSVRFVSIGFWTAAALMVFLLVYRATGSLPLAALMHILGFRAMRFIGNEPAHPQEACIFLLMALGLACYSANRTWRMAWLGILTGAMLATKINLGIFAVIALAVAFACAAKPGWLRTAAIFAVAAGALAFPVLLMWGHRGDYWAVMFCLLVVVSLASAILTVSRMEWDVHVSLREIVTAGLCCAAAIAALCYFPLAHGSTIHGLVEYLIVKPRTSIGQAWFLAAHVNALAPVWAGAGLVFAWCVATKRVSLSLVAKAKLVFGLAVGVLSACGLYSELVTFATPFLFLAAVRPAQGEPGSQDSLARTILVLIGVLQVLYAYPVAGSQIQLVTVFMIAVAGVCFWDGISLRVVNERAKVFQVVIPMVLAASYLFFIWRAQLRYEALEPLALPGAHRMHVEPERATALRAVVSQVNASACGTLLTVPGLYSFNFWTGKPAPNGLDFGAWVVFMSAAEEDRVVQELSRDPHACVIQRQEIVDMWTHHGDVSSQPLVRYIRENFQTVFETYGYTFMVRKP